MLPIIKHKALGKFDTNKIEDIYNIAILILSMPKKYQKHEFNFNTTWN